MLKRGEIVVVKDTKSFNSMRLSKLNKRRGVVDKIVCSEGKPIAAYVTFKKNKSSTTVLIPIKSLESVSTVNQLRTLNILKQTYL